jgi:hypothetical protein
MRLLVGPIALLFTTAPMMSEANVQWCRFQPPMQAFSIRMPAEVTQSKRSTRTAAGLIETHVWSANLDATLLAVSITSLPDVATWFTSDDGLYQKTRESLMREFGAALGKVEKVKHGPFGQQIAYRIPPTAGAPAREGRALISVAKGTIVVINAIVSPSTEVSLDDLFRGLSMDRELAQVW